MSNKRKAEIKAREQARQEEAEEDKKSA